MNIVCQQITGMQHSCKLSNSMLQGFIRQSSHAFIVIFLKDTLTVYLFYLLFMILMEFNSYNAVYSFMKFSFGRRMCCMRLDDY